MMETDANSPDLLSDRAPLPQGYRFWIYPTYRLETPVVCRSLPDTTGILLAFMIVNRGKRLWTGELFDAIYGSDEDGGADTGLRIIQVHVYRLRRALREIGIEPVIDSMMGRSGYIFRGFSVCAIKNAQSPKDLSARYQRARERICARKSRAQ
jgi:DNA-binding winged helix-turn-helix (wHTH) protein